MRRLIVSAGLSLVGMLFISAASTELISFAEERQPVREPALRDELLRRMREDQDARKLAGDLQSNSHESELQEIDWDKFAGELDLDAGTVAEVKAALERARRTKMSAAALADLKKGIVIDRANTARMKEIVDRFGWPGKSLVGEQAANAAWLLVQHADLDRPFQRKCLGLLEKAVREGEAERKQLAYLTDRVLVAEKRKQIYGTQFDETNGTLQPQPIEDESNVDRRRKEVGLEPLAEYVRKARQFYFPTSTAP